MRKSSLTTLIVLACIMALTACSSGGSSNDSRPVADAGPDQIVETGSLVTLDGSDSYDRKGEDLTYLWNFTSWPNDSDPELFDITAANPYFTPDVHGNYVLTLVVSNGTEDSAPDSVTITSAPRPVAHWAFEEGIGTIAGDSIGTNHGTLMGPVWVPGMVGDWALEFDGIDDYISLPYSDNADIFNADEFTISFWLYSINDRETRGIIRRSGGWHIRKDSRNELQFCIEIVGPIGSEPTCFDSGYILPDRQWLRYEIAVVNGSEVTFYVNGNSYKSLLTDSFASSNRNPILFIGRYNDDAENRYRFRGQIDDVRFYDSALGTVEP